MKISWIGSPNFRSQTNVKKRFIVMHWMVGTLAGTDRVFQSNTRRVATNYGIAGKTIHQYVKDKDYAFGSGTTRSNKYGISIEHEGGWKLNNGSRKKPTKSTHDTSAELCAKIARDHKIGALVVGKNMFPHSYFVSTQCSGSLDLEYIAKAANEINASFCISEEDEVATPTTKPSPLPLPIAKVAKPVSKTVYYTVKSGDSYWKIATNLLKAAGKSTNIASIVAKSAQLQGLNKVKSLRPGQKLIVRKG
jgi:LysM repeat protein